MYAASLYPDDGSPSGELSVGEQGASGSTVTFMFEKPPLAEGGTLTLEVFAFKEGTAEVDPSKNAPLLTGRESGLVADGASMTVEAMTLTPNTAGNAPKGTVSLKVTVPGGCALEIDGADKDKFTVTGTTSNFTVEQAGEGISADTYTLTFKVTKNSETLHAFADTINVLPGMLTDTWSGLAAGEALEVTEQNMSRTFYVRGSGAGWYSANGYSDSDYTPSDSNAGTFLAPFATIQKAIDTVIAANGGDYTIYVDGTLAATSSAALADFKNVSKHLNVTVAGLAGQKATLDGKNTARVINAGTDDAAIDISLTLENLTVQNGKNDGGRGAGVTICSTSGNSHTIRNCEIKGCEADYGAAIYNKHGELSLENCAISGNITDTSGTVYNGGSATAILTMSGVSITGNEAGNGGGIFIGGDGTGGQDGASTVRISDFSVVIQNNTSTKSKGDGICIWQGRLELSGSAKIADVIYLNDSSQHVTVAGDLTATTPVATITPSSYAEDRPLLSAGDGVTITQTICAKFALTSEQWTLVPDGEYGVLKVLTECYVQGQANRTYAPTTAASDLNPGSKMMPFATIQKAVETAIANGSGEYTIYVDGTLKLASTEQAGAMGMADFSALDEALKLTIRPVSDTKESTLNANSLTRVMYVSSASGGSLDLELERLVITGGKINGNGGGIVVLSEVSITMSGCKISDNTASNYGGGVHVLGGAITMKDGTISYNTSSRSSGGGVCVNDGAFTMSGGTISDNTADSYGGGVYATGGAFIMTGGTISGNTASSYGGGVYVFTAAFTMTGAAKVSEDNDVYLYTLSGNTITVAGTLTATAPVATITPNAYTDGRKVLSAGSGVTITQDICGQFKLTPDPDGGVWVIVPDDTGAGVLKPK